MAHFMEVTLTFRINCDMQMEYPYADLRTLAGQHYDAGLLQVQSQQDPAYMQGIVKLQEIWNAIGRLPKGSASDEERVALEARAETIKGLLRQRFRERNAVQEAVA